MASWTAFAIGYAAVALALAAGIAAVIGLAGRPPCQ